MFPSAGYFRSAPCPFFIHGLCHRPYCHFKHVKPVKEQHKVSTPRDTHTYVSSKSNNAEKVTTKAGLSKNKKEEIDFEKETRNEEEDSFITSEEKETVVAPVLTDITSLLKIPSGVQSNTDTSDNDTSKEQSADEEKGSQKKQSKQMVNSLESKKISRKLTDIDFFSSLTPKSNFKKSSKSAVGKGIKRKVSESNEDIIEKGKNKKDLLKKSNPTKKLAVENGMKGKSKGANIQAKAHETPVTGNLKEQLSKKLPFEATDLKPKPALKRTSSGTLDYIPETCIETVGHGSIKKRVAHTDDNEYTQRQVVTSQAPRSFPRKPSYVSPVISGIAENRVVAVSSSIENKKSDDKKTEYSSEDGQYLGKKRTAHPLNFYKQDKAKSTLKRPRIPIEYGAKVPQNIRQRYLDKLIDEYLPKCLGEQEAFDKAVEEEAVIYQRSTRRQIYMNLCVNAIKRIRDLPSPEESDANENEVNNPLVTAGTTTRMNPSTTPIHATQMKATSKVSIRPSAPSLAAVKKKHSSLLEAKQGKVINRRPSQEPAVLTEALFYEHLLGYLANEDSLWENNYPRTLPGQPGTAQIKKKAKEPSETETKRICIRCGKQFFMDEDGEYVTKEECHYHWGKIRRIRGRGEISMNFSCCQGEAGSLGCCACKLHVSDFNRTPFGYVTTNDSTISRDNRKVYSLDCEMCYTSHGLELTRVSVVNFDLQEVYDTFVKPDRDIIDYNTRFSGVSEHHLRDVKTTLKDVQNDLLNMFNKDTILMGHSLESDLKALKIIHDKVVDTALVFPHKMGLPYKRALRNLMADHLQKIIQDSEGGHDSSEDSSACMELMRWKVTEDIKKKARTKHY